MTRPLIRWTLAIIFLGWACQAADPPSGNTPSEPATPTSSPSSDPAWDEAWAALFARLIADADETAPVVGTGGWLFFAPELRHLSLGRFWGPEARAVSRATDPRNADPLAAIVDFYRQLTNAGIELLFVPVPAKAAIYPEHLPADPPGAVSPDHRADPRDRALLGALAERGVPVLDLAPFFLTAKTSGPALYCRTDTHWSPHGIARAAEAIAQRIGRRPWTENRPAIAIDSEERAITFEGDLWRRLPAPRPDKESVPATLIAASDASAGASFPIDRQSPVLLLGDSHALVFHAGADMHARGAGLPEHLALRLGRGVDLVAVRGSGATPARINLLRRGDGLDGKRIVVWVISVREYTEGQGWAKVPILPG